MNEEEKKVIEELSKKAVICNYEERDYPNMICFKKDMIIALNLIEKLQKENEELEEINNELEAEKNDAIRRYNFETIPIKKVKDKIEYLEDYIEENSDEQGYWGNINPDVVYGQIEILEEILKLESE